MVKKVLHVCSYYIGSKLYRNLFYALDQRFVNQFISVPTRERSHTGLNQIELQSGKFFYFRSWFWYHRLLYNRKIQKAFTKIDDICHDINFEIIHAHTWFSDGGIAYFLNRKYNIPYIIAIRDTDLNLFYKKLPFKRRFGHKILLNASKIVFINQNYYKELLKLIPEKLNENLRIKSIVIPNGIDSFWFENSIKNIKIPLKDHKLNLLYIGEISRRKNILRIIKAYKKLEKMSVQSTLTLVGFTNQGFYEKFIKLRYSNLKGLSFVERVTDKQELLEYYRNADLFIMPSLTETFGLVYIEALSQGLPIIYSKGQGVDGYFDVIKVGVAVNPKSVNEIANAIREIYDNYYQYIPQNLSFLDQFGWQNIAHQYVKLYEEVKEIN